MSHKIYFTPGPSQLYYTLDQHIKNAIKEDIGEISHRGLIFQNLFADAREKIQEVLNLPEGYEIFFLGSATEIWERILQNLVEDSAHFFVNGSFSRRFHEFGTVLKPTATSTSAPDGIDFESMDVPTGSELIGLTLNETSTGFTINMEDIRTIRQTYPDSLIALDVVSIAPAVPIDFSLIDTAYFSVQKCFGLPAGLGVWIVNQRCIDKARYLKSKGIRTGTYHSLEALKSAGDKNQTPETPNVLLIYLLARICEDMLRRGMKMIHNETIYKSTLIYNTYESLWFLSPFVQSNIHRSKTVCIAEAGDKQKDVLDFMSKKGFIIGSGYGNYKNTHLRIANFPTHSREQIEMLVDYLNKFAPQ